MRISWDISRDLGGEDDGLGRTVGRQEQTVVKVEEVRSGSLGEPKLKELSGVVCG